MSDLHPTIEAPVTVVPPTAVDAVRVSAPLSPATTEEQDRKTAGQRQINKVWEYTQAFIAVSVIGTALAVNAYVAIKGPTAPVEINQSALMQLNVMAVMVTTFYFVRTNHTRSGGVGGDVVGGGR